jgi:ribokinase
MTAPANVCVLGSINVDLVVRSPRLPHPGETLLGGPYRTFPGGKGANQAVAASRLGARVQMVGAVGDDASGREHLGGMLHEGVDTSFVFTRQGTPTGVALITVADMGG